MRWSNVGLFAALAGLAGVFGLAYRTFSASGPESPTQAHVAMAAPFNGLPESQTDEHAWLEEAMENYQRLLEDQLPSGTCRDAGAFSDGGTHLWECTGYSLRLQKSIATVGGRGGYLYGPVLVLGPDTEISHVEFYTQEALVRRCRAVVE